MIVVSCDLNYLKYCETLGHFCVHPGYDLGALSYDLLYSCNPYFLWDVWVEDSVYSDHRFSHVWGCLVKGARQT